jgi:predicted 3-demethylubiquinone-9 3-methyltransferase (glyoxalase superfamily)
VKLSEGGQALMPLDAYPFSERFGWIQDKYGLSWQLILTDPEGEPRPPIIPALMFVGEVSGKAEEASDLYISVFDDARRGAMARWGAGMEPDVEGTVMFSDFQLEGQWFACMDSAHEHAFAFNEAVSLLVRCADQAEIDRLWARLSAVPEAEQCGWLKDRYGLSWQIAPADMERLIDDADPERAARVTKAFLAMKKFDLAELRRAYEGG